MLAWRDLDDDEAGGSEVHAHNIASIWVQSGIEVTHRTSASTGRPAEAERDAARRALDAALEKPPVPAPAKPPAKKAPKAPAKKPAAKTGR